MAEPRKSDGQPLPTAVCKPWHWQSLSFGVRSGNLQQVDETVNPDTRITLNREVPMNPNTVSVFDLSPSEKLQLVEDLWDDLAATPSEVPVYEWQKEELARRKANLMTNPASGLSWVEVKNKIRRRHGR